ncbi:MAG: hypothetical protein ACK5JR_17215 [Tropicimonas sp.]|uniref:hypothetical protein n=1 Tax=Tropicimonas sp. TaxID=2067044 RepID=UPI003A83C9E8
MMHANLRPLDAREIDEISGGFICGGLCVLGGIIAGVGLYATGVTIGSAWGKATKR